MHEMMKLVKTKKKHQEEDIEKSMEFEGMRNSEFTIRKSTKISAKKETDRD